jgi:hypothetical protein
MRRALLAAGVVLVASVAGAAAQTRAPVTSEPLPIAPPASAGPAAQEQFLREQKAREERNAQRERDRLDLEYRRERNRQAEQGSDLLRAPAYVPPPYAAPQYQAPAGGPAGGAGHDPATTHDPATSAPTYGQAYGPGYGVPHTGGRLCQQYAPAYDEAGRFLANVCIR